MVLLNDDFEAFADVLQHNGEVVRDFVECHVNRCHTFDKSRISAGTVRLRAEAKWPQRRALTWLNWGASSATRHVKHRNCRLGRVMPGSGDRRSTHLQTLNDFEKRQVLLGICILPAF